jgi:16S rRNA (guanine966-N2)-methyltransferase
MPKCLFYNIESFATKEAVNVLTADFRPALKKLRKMEFDIIFADPPYETQYAVKTMFLIDRHRLLRNGGMIVLEHSHLEHISSPDAFSVFKQKKYGDTMVSFLEHTQNSQNSQNINCAENTEP